MKIFFGDLRIVQQEMIVAGILQHLQDVAGIFSASVQCIAMQFKEDNGMMLLKRLNGRFNDFVFKTFNVEFDMGGGESCFLNDRSEASLGDHGDIGASFRWDDKVISGEGAGG